MGSRPHGVCRRNARGAGCADCGTKKDDEVLSGYGIKVQKIILYGSHASGEPKEWSDIDLIVISDNFKEMDLWQRLTLLGRASAKLRKPIEALGYTREEFNSKGSGSFVGDEVKTKGVEV